MSKTEINSKTENSKTIGKRRREKENYKNQ